MLLPLVIHVPLVARLRPAAHLGPVVGRVLHLGPVHRRAEREDEDPREPAVGHHGGIARVGVREPGQLVELRLVVDVEPVLAHGHVELHRLEKVALAGAGEDGHAVRRGTQLLAHPAPDPLDVPVVALTLRRVRLEGAAAGRELAAEEPVYLVLPVLVGLRVEVQAEHGEGGRREGGESVEKVLLGRHGSSRDGWRRWSPDILALPAEVER